MSTTDETLRDILQLIAHVRELIVLDPEEGPHDIPLRIEVTDTETGEVRYEIETVKGWSVRGMFGVTREYQGSGWTVSHLGSGTKLGRATTPDLQRAMVIAALLAFAPDAKKDWVFHALPWSFGDHAEQVKQFRKYKRLVDAAIAGANEILKPHEEGTK